MTLYNIFKTNCIKSPIILIFLIMLLFLIKKRKCYDLTYKNYKSN